MPGGLCGAALSVDSLLESLFNGVERSLRDIAGVAQWPHDGPGDDLSGPDGVAGGVDVSHGELVVGHAPMPLEALGGYARANAASEWHSLGKSAVVPVQQRGRVGVKGVYL